MNVSLPAARAFWLERQGLAAPQAGDPAGVVARTGWVRTLGGAEVYLAVRARVPGLRRQELDRASAALELRVIPAVRGCIYLVPREHVPWALRFSEVFFRKRNDRELEVSGSSWKEVEAVAGAVRGALGGASMTTDALRRALPKDAVRSFGEKGKKVGLSSPLPVALRLLELRGELERTLEDGRLDTERYLWRRSKRSVFDGARLPEALAELAARLLTIYLEQVAPVTLKDFAGWAGLSQRDAKAAAALVDTATVSVEGYGEALVLRKDLDVLSAGAAGGVGDALALLPFEDNFTVSHGGPGLLVDPKHHRIPVPIWGSSKDVPLGDATHLSYRAIVHAGRVVGFWELDAGAKGLATSLFEPLPPKARKALEAKADDTARFLLEEVGHGRCVTLDTDETVRERAGKLKAMKAAR